MRYLCVIIVMFCFNQLALADKPDWAGEGGKPSDHEIEEHRDDMKDKSKGKGNKKNKDSDDFEDELRDRVADEIDDAIRGK